MKKYTLLFILILVIAFIGSCNKHKDNKESYKPTPYTLVIPGNLPKMVISSENPLTVEGIALGRRLYYDSLLHPTHAMACASCHFQEFGFTTPGTHVIPHINLGYNHSFLWNAGVTGTLEDAAQFEVVEFFKSDISKLQSCPVYPDLYYKAFGNKTINAKNTAYAIAQFLRTLVSGDSKFDRYQRHETGLSYEETKGMELFFSEKGDCFHCHPMPLMTDYSIHNIGLDSLFSGVNQGHYLVNGNKNDLGKFKTPSLRNCALRTSFMHDGRYKTLEEVIEHYNSGVKHSVTLDPILTKPGKEFGLQLTSYEKQCIKTFLYTLTDSTYLHNPSYSSPFK